MFLCLCLFVWFCISHLSGFFPLFLVLSFCCNPLSCHNKQLTIWFPAKKDQAWAPNGTSESKTLDCQRAPSRKSVNLWDLPQRLPPVCKGLAAPQDTSPKHQQDKNTNSTIGRQTSHRHPKTHHLTQPCSLEGKKLSPPPTRMQRQVLPTCSLCKQLDQPNPPRAETKKEGGYGPTAWEKETPNTVSVRK